MSINTSWKATAEWWESLSPNRKLFAKAFAFGFFSACFLVLVLGCGGDSNAPTRIARNGQEIQQHTQEQRELAESAKDSASKIGEEAGDNPNVAAHVGNIVKAQDDIRNEADAIDSASKNIVMDSTRVEGKVPWWGTAINRIALVVLVLLVAALAWYSGLLNFVRRWIGAFTPAVVGQAKLDYEALDAPPVADEMARHRVAISIAARRAADPAYDGAFRKVSRQKKLAK
jgi:hypothetical protein